MSVYVPKPCCIAGSVHTGTPTGTTTTLHNLPCYIAEPPTNPPKAIIVFIADVFGWSTPNSRLLADIYAKRTGARVYVPDFMGGKAFPKDCMHILTTVMEPQPNIVAALWFKTWPFLQALYYVAARIPYIGDSPCRPRVTGFLKGIRENEARELGNVKVGVAGFCWGGHHVVDLCTGGNGVEGVTMEDGRPLVDAGFTAHPGQFKEVPGDVEKVTLPLSVSIGTVDFILSVEQSKEIQRVLETKQGEWEAKTEGVRKVKYEMDIIPNARHGFAIRHRQDDEEETKQAKRAEDQAVAFFTEWLEASA